MYEKNKIYKVETEGKVFSTGQIIEEDSNLIKIKTLDKFGGETRIISKTKIVNSWEVQE